MNTQLLVNEHTQTNTTTSLKRSAVPDKRQTVYVRIDSSFDTQSLEALDAAVGVQTPNLLTINLPIGNITALAELQGVLFVDVGHKAKPLLKDAIVDIQADKVWAGEGVPTGAYTGNGVIVGIIDQGFDFTHPTFYTDGTSKIRKVWMQNDTRGTPPAAPALQYGTEYNTADLPAVQTSNIGASHGTHVAGIAAGTGGALGEYVGVAPGAELVLVEYDGYDAQIADGIKYIFDYAQSVGKPAVVNISLGHHGGPHNGTSEFDRMLDNMVGRGRVVVGAVGNEGDMKMHAQHTFTARKEVRIAVTPLGNDGLVCANLTPATDFEWAVEVWNKTERKRVFLTGFFKSAYNEGFQDHLAVIDGQTIKYSAASYGTKSNYMYAYFQAIFTNPNPNKLAVTFVFRASAGTLNVWNGNGGNGNAAELFGATANSADAWLTPDREYTTGEIGGTARRIISVGAYNIRNQNSTAYTAPLRTVSTFSSHGPTADWRTKPDIIAPGSYIYSSINSLDVYKGDYSQTNIKPEPDATHAYAMMQGTSMATPMVTGLVALMLEANPALTPDTIAALLRKYAAIDDAIKNRDKNVRGYGKVNALATLANIDDREDLPLSIRSVFSRGDDAAPPLFTIVPNPNKGTFHLRFDDAGQGEMLVYNLIGTLLHRQPVTSHQALSLQHLPTGIYVIRLQLGKQLSAQKMAINN
ncbi:hypothetical protein FACS189456_0440 [Bacteroidia bacterium]|nr:hypothetical protein FACS189456_0440 [Bacteroidia bacterium]